MKKETFIEKHSPAWQELESLVTQIEEANIKKLSSKETKRFLQLFRKCSHHLAYARTHYPDSNITNYLNALIGDCHSHVYGVKKISPALLLDYLFYRLPELLREYKWYLLASFGFFALGSIVGLGLVFYEPDLAQFILPGQYIEPITEGSAGSSQWNYPLMSSRIMINNITVALRAFVLGITLGLGTIYILFYNGLLLGGLTALVHLFGNPLEYWSLILPHGVIELPAIWISGAAGLIIARHMLLPGEYSRKDSLIAGAKKAVSLTGGIILLLIAAGLIEGFFTPQAIEAKWKLIASGVLGSLLTFYFLLPLFRRAGRRP